MTDGTEAQDDLPLLINRLRKYAHAAHAAAAWGFAGEGLVMDKAADTIAHLTAERDAALADREDFAMQLLAADLQASDAYEAMQAMKAEHGAAVALISWVCRQEETPPFIVLHIQKTINDLPRKPD